MKTWKKTASAFLLLIPYALAHTSTPKIAVANTLFDPESARFTREFNVGNFACVEVNAKNLYGAYVGKKTVFLKKKKTAWTIYDKYINFEDCKYSATLNAKTEIEARRAEIQEREYDLKLENEQKKNPTRKPIHRDLLTCTTCWFEIESPKTNAELKASCTGWLSATIKQDIAYQFGMESRYSHDGIYEIYTESHPMTTELNKLIKEVTEEKHLEYITKHIIPNLKLLGKNIDDRIGSANSSLGAKYKLQILNAKSDEVCGPVIKNYDFVFYNKTKQPALE